MCVFFVPKSHKCSKIKGFGGYSDVTQCILCYILSNDTTAKLWKLQKFAKSNKFKEEASRQEYPFIRR